MGLLLMVAGFVARARSGAVVTVLLSAGGILAAFGAYTFAYVLWRTLDGPKRKLVRSSVTRSNRPSLPLAEPAVATREPAQQMNG